MHDSTTSQSGKGSTMVYDGHGMYAIISSTGNKLYEGPFDECMDEYERITGIHEDANN